MSGGDDRDTERLDYMDDAFSAENIRTGANDDGEWGYIRRAGGEDRWYPTLRRAIDDAMEYERLKAESHNIGDEMRDASAR